MLFRNIQALRGVAAMLVVLQHLVQTVAAFYASHGADAGLLAPAAPSMQAFGIVGVDIFFVISGFVLFLSAERSTGRVEETGRVAVAGAFLLDRLVRIFPLYWVVFLFTAATTEIVVPGSLARALTDVREIFLLDTTNAYGTVPPAWTLMYELYFYLWMAAFTLVAPRRLAGVVLFWLLAHLALMVAARAGLAPMQVPAADPILLDFGAGAVLAMALKRGIVPRPALCLALAPLFLAAGYLVFRDDFGEGPLDRFTRFSTFGAFAILLVAAAVGLEARGRFVAARRQPLGDASYSLYLWHLTVFWTLNWTGTTAGVYDFRHPYLTALVWLLAAIVVGLGSYRFVERPLLDLMRTRRGNRVAAQPA